MRISLPLKTNQHININTTNDSSDGSTNEDSSSLLVASEEVASHYSTDSLSDDDELEATTIHIWEKDQLKPSKPPTPPKITTFIKKKSNSDDDSDDDTIGEIPGSNLSTLIISVPNKIFSVTQTIAIKSKVSITHLDNGQ